MNYELACGILEISPPDDEIQIIKRQYRMKALMYHPDKNNSPDACEQFQQVNEAYEFLMKRKGSSFSPKEKNYKDYLFSFLKSILTNENQFSLFHLLIDRILEKCEDHAISLLSQIDKKILARIYKLFYLHRDILHFSDHFLSSIQEIINEKVRTGECIILHPLLDDLFDANLYRMVENDNTYIIPLWHHELVYDNLGGDLYVQCVPILPENVSINENNDMEIQMTYNIQDIWYKDRVEIQLGKRIFFFSPRELKIVERQTYILYNQGIPAINTDDIYDISDKRNVILIITILFE